MSIPLVIKNEGTDESPRLITNHEDFKNRQFDELWEWATTPKFSLDRNIKINCKTDNMASQEACKLKDRSPGG